MKIYNTFHISILVLYNHDQLPSQPLKPPPSIIIKAELKYELEEIIDLRLQYNKLQYRARWTGYTAEHDKSWYPANHFENQDFAKLKIHCRCRDKLHLDQACGTGHPRQTHLVQQAVSKQAALYWLVKAATPQENCGTMRCLLEMTRTSIPYHSPYTEEEAEHKHKKYKALNWTEYYNDNCWVHNSDKVA